MAKALTHIKDLRPDPENARTHNPRNIGLVVDALHQVGAARSIVIDEDDVVLAGNGVVEGAAEAGITKVRVVDVDGSTLVAVRRRGLTVEQKRALALYDNRAAELSEWNPEQLQRFVADGVDLQAWFSDAEIAPLLGLSGIGAEEARASLAERFGVPPFSVLDARQGYWQDRKAAWLALGIQSELGRGGEGQPNAAPGGSALPGVRGPRKDYKPGRTGADGTPAATATSVFDPVLCELAYRWFCPPDGLVLDPFAGGSVRGIVAGKLGRQYLGVDLSEAQIEANRPQATEILGAAARGQVQWIQGDSQNVLPTLGQSFDFLFTCPPYGDLEVYSDDPADLSTLEFEAFADAYRAIIAASCALLKTDRFACVVVGDYRDKDGKYRNFPGLTIEAFTNAGLALYNEAILVTAVGSLPIRVASMFESSRKLGKTHQNVLVFVKGDPRAATEAIGPVEFALPLEEPAEAAVGLERFGEPL